MTAWLVAPLEDMAATVPGGNQGGATIGDGADGLFLMAVEVRVADELGEVRVQPAFPYRIRHGYAFPKVWLWHT